MLVFRPVCIVRMQASNKMERRKSAARRRHLKISSTTAAVSGVSISSATTTSADKPTSGRAKKIKVSDGLPLPPPDKWRFVLTNIREMRNKRDAPVDTMGCEKCGDKEGDPRLFRLHTLVSLMLSSQTRDEVVYAAMNRLKSRELDVPFLVTVPENDLEDLLNPVGFYKRKACYLKRTAEILREKYDSDIPGSLEELCSLPGVGPKMAHICMRVAWNRLSGIGVDTHVHRISNRLGWVGSKGTSTPEETRKALESWLPESEWLDLNALLVGFGQQICLPTRPHCGECLNQSICPFGNKSK